MKHLVYNKYRYINKVGYENIRKLIRYILLKGGQNENRSYQIFCFGFE